MNKGLPASLGLLGGVVIAPVITLRAWADDGGGVTDLEEVILTGVRGEPRTVLDSPVTVDVFNSAQIDAVSHTDTNDILQTLVPS